MVWACWILPPRLAGSGPKPACSSVSTSNQGMNAQKTVLAEVTSSKSKATYRSVRMLRKPASTSKDTCSNGWSLVERETAINVSDCPKADRIEGNGKATDGDGEVDADH
eukprot:gene17891-24283_t